MTPNWPLGTLKVLMFMTSARTLVVVAAILLAAACGGSAATSSSGETSKKASPTVSREQHVATVDACTLVTADELPYWLEKGVQFFCVHSDPFLHLGLNGIKKSVGR